MHAKAGAEASVNAFGASLLTPNAECRMPLTDARVGTIIFSAIEVPPEGNNFALTRLPRVIIATTPRAVFPSQEQSPIQHQLLQPNPRKLDPSVKRTVKRTRAELIDKLARDR